MTQQIVVIGGGITGLAAAFDAELYGAEVTVLEASDRLGGKLQTSAFAGKMVNEGADAFLARVPEAIQLCEDLGYARHELATPAQRTAYIFHDGALRRIPQPMVLGVPLDVDALLASGLVDEAEAAGLSADLARTDPADDHADSVGQLIRTRMGDAIADRLVGPLLGGINAGDVDRLSLAAGAPQLAAAAAAGPSLATELARQRAAVTTLPTAPVFFTVPGGLRSLVDRLAEHLIGEVRTNTPVHEIRRGDDTRWVVVADREYPADRVIITAPAPVAEALVSPHVGPTPLGDIEYAGVAMTTFAFAADDVPIPLDASGFLVPHSEGLLMTAATWASAKWEHLAGGPVVLRVSAGRFGDERALHLDDDDLVAALRADLETTMGIVAAPTEVRVTRWEQSFPQYTPGHADRVAEIEQILAGGAPGLTVAGAALRGIGIPACVRQGRAAGGHRAD